MRLTKKIYAILLGLGVCASTILAQTPGTFSATGNMIMSRFLHTATLLADGRVLIAGGDMIEAKAANPPPFKAQSSAELYNPATGMFTATGDMTTPRSGHTATLLPSGKVLIAGGGIATAMGLSGDPTLASAELYDPGTGTFSAVGNMSTPRMWATATLLSNGKVLIAGGLNLLAGLASAELYDPSTRTFTATGVMHEMLADTATLLPNGKVLITRSTVYDDSQQTNETFVRHAELYDPVTGTFEFTGDTVFHHNGPTATLLPNGQVLIAGGDWGDGDGALPIAEVYDPVTGTFALAGDMMLGREQHTATLLSDGTVLMAGGHNIAQLTPAATAELYTSVIGGTRSTGNMLGRRELHTATLLKDGRVLIAGGDDERYWLPETILATAELYCPLTVNCLPEPWHQAIATMKAAAGTDNLNFFQWAWYWQMTPAFSGVPNGFGVAGSISPNLITRITAAGGGDPLLIVSAEQWVSYFRQVVPQ